MRWRWIKAATTIFANTKYFPDDEDIALLAESMALVEIAGLRGLNQRLVRANRKVFDIIAELNLATMLIRHHGGTGIEYEPGDYGQRPVDFRVKCRDIVVHLQMKRFGGLERDNRRDAMYECIKQGAAEINVPRYFGIALSEGFSEVHIAAFLQFVAATAEEAMDGGLYDFSDAGTVLATVEFWYPRSTNLCHLTLGVASDAQAVNISGLAADQIRASLRKAAAAFTAPVDQKNLNLVVAESDRHHDIDICEACFGTEEDLLRPGGPHTWHRLGDGVFAENAINQRVAGVVMLRRPDPSKPVSTYEAFLLINEHHLQWIDQIRKAIPVVGVLRYNTRP